MNSRRRKMGYVKNKTNRSEMEKGKKQTAKEIRSWEGVR